MGCLSTAVQIVIASMGGHKSEWAQDRKDVFHKALFYHFMNNIGWILASKNLKSRNYSSIFFGLGTLLFSGVLYYRCFTNEKKYSFLNPFGGVSMILGWVLLAFRL